MSAATTPMFLRIDATARERLQKLAERHKRSSHALATEAIYEMINKKEREDAFNQSCIDSYNHFKETGLHAAHDEVAAWMDSWGTNHELPAPTCRT